MMTAKLFNSNNLEGLVAEITENFDYFYAKPAKRAAKKAKEFVFSPKAYGWAALYGAGYGTYTYIVNDDKDFLIRAGSAIYRFSASLFLGRQCLRAAQLIGKKIKNPWIAYSAGMVAPFSAWAFIVYGSMRLMGAEHLTLMIIADVALTPSAMFGPMYFERNNIELHLAKGAYNYIKKKLKRGRDYEKL